MTPLDIVRVLSAAAPIVATVASAATKTSEPVIERREEPKVINNNNVTISITNNFYVNSAQEAEEISNSIQRRMLESFSSGERYKL